MGGDIFAHTWSARLIHAPPERTWSPQQQEVIKAVGAGCLVVDATSLLLRALPVPIVDTDEGLVMEAVRASFRITRKADRQSVPPCRLRSFNFIVFEEISQLTEQV